MKRDMDLVRKLLIELEDLPPTHHLNSVENDRIEAEHMALLEEAGFAEGELIRLVNGYPMVTLTRLTWEGHDFLGAIRNQGVWNTVKERLSDLGSVPFDVVKETAKTVLLQLAKDLAS